MGLDEVVFPRWTEDVQEYCASLTGVAYLVLLVAGYVVGVAFFDGGYSIVRFEAG